MKVLFKSLEHYLTTNESIVQLKKDLKPHLLKELMLVLHESMED